VLYDEKTVLRLANRYGVKKGRVFYLVNGEIRIASRSNGEVALERRDLRSDWSPVSGCLLDCFTNLTGLQGNVRIPLPCSGKNMPQVSVSFYFHPRWHKHGRLSEAVVVSFNSPQDKSRGRGQLFSSDEELVLLAEFAAMRIVDGMELLKQLEVSHCEDVAFRVFMGTLCGVLSGTVLSV
jgi:hypothetical protein